MKNEFELSNEQLVEIANDLDSKIYKGMTVDGSEIKCIPTFIQPNKDGVKGEATVFDLGGTNFRAATVRVGDSTDVMGRVEKKFESMKTPGYTREDLFNAIFQVAGTLNPKDGSGVGYCFSYPTKSLINGDAELICWTKGVNIPEMEGKPVGRTLIDYLNSKTLKSYGKVTVVNDTITSLFAGLSYSGHDAYVGLIVGTGTNMAAFYPSTAIPKLKYLKEWSGDTPVNLESGNFHPPHLTKYDDAVDAKSDNAGFQRFEKAISGMYVGRIFYEVFPNDGFDPNMDAAKLSHVMRHPAEYKPEHSEVAYQIYIRSAKLAAASIAGLVASLVKVTPTIKDVMVLAEGTMFWSNEVYKNAVYVNTVNETLPQVLTAMGYGDVSVKIARMANANLIGAAISVLS